MAKTICTTAPRSFLFYIVADVSFPGEEAQTCRPLAVAYRQGHGIGPCRPFANPVPFDHQRIHHLLEDCARIVAILTDPTNRAALEAEVALAKAQRANLDDVVRHADRPEVPDTAQPGFDLSIPCDTRPRPPARPELPFTGGVREYPFTSTCLRVALNADREYHTRFGDVREHPLDTVFRGDKLEYGAVVFDITHPSNPTYGILSPSIRYELRNAEDIFRWDPVEPLYLQDEPLVRLEQKSTSRRLLSVSAYMRKYRCHDETPAVQRLSGHDIVRPWVLKCNTALSLAEEHTTHGTLDIWPPSRPGTGPTTVAAPVREVNMDEQVSHVMEQARIHGGVDIDAHRDALNQAGFQECLMARLQQDPDALSRSGSATQLLRLAYSGLTHLNWVSCTNLTFEVLARALGSVELKDARALSICVDDMSIDDSAEHLITALANHGQIHTICFLQGPRRPDDEKSARIFAHLRASAAGRKLLGSKRIILTCAFAAPFPRKRWLPRPLPSAPPLLSSFPVRYMLVRQQYLNISDNSRAFRPCHFSLADVFLKPEQLVAGFLRYCQSVIADRFLLSFAATPSDGVSSEEDFPGTTIHPIPAENIATPESWTVSLPGQGERTVDLWPAFRPVEPGGWVILLSREWHQQPLGTANVPGIPLVRYAFLRAKQRIALPVRADTVIEVGEGYIEVKGGVKDFLRETAPSFSEEKADAQVEQSVQAIRRLWPGRFPDGVSPVSILDEEEARSVFKDFLHDSIRVRGNLKMAMQDIPEGERWYPEFMTDRTQTTNPRKRRRRTESEGSSSVFRSLYDPETRGGENPVGTDRAPMSPLPPSYPFPSCSDDDL